MKDSIPVEVIYGLQKLVHVVFYAIFGQVVSPPLDSIIKVHVHQLED